MLTGVLAGLLLAGVIWVLGIDWWMERSARGQIYRQIDDVPSHKVALVLGARVYPNGELSAMLEDRVKAGVALYKAGRVEKLLMSGDNSERHYDEVTAMRRRAIDLGVPSDDVVRDFAGFRTYDSLVRARELWGLKDLVVVSQEFHLPRAIFIARALGMDADGYVAIRPGGYGGHYTHSRRREIPARAVAWLDLYVLGTEPHFLGPPEGLSGDAQRETPPGK